MSTLRANTITDAEGTGAPTFPNGAQTIRLGTSVASTSGTAIDFTGIPAGVRRVTVMFNGVSTSGTSGIRIQIGTSSGVETTGYVSVGSSISGGGTNTDGATVAFEAARVAVAASNFDGHIILSSFGGNTWVEAGTLTVSSGIVLSSAGSKTLASILDRVRITTRNGTDTFDAGSINISWEF